MDNVKEKERTEMENNKQTFETLITNFHKQSIEREGTEEIHKVSDMQ